MTKPAAFNLIKTRENSFKLLKRLRGLDRVKWATQVYGPHQIAAYSTAESDEELTNFIESLREKKGVQELDARMCKPLPDDKEEFDIDINEDRSAVLLTNVDYERGTEEGAPERFTTYNLRDLEGVKISRAMWGPADIISVVEAEDHEKLRDLICDDVKLMKAVTKNSTLYCYPRSE